MKYSLKQKLLQKTRKDTEGHYIMIKRSIQKEDIIIENIYTLNIQAAQYIRQMLIGIQGEIYSSTWIIMDLKIPLTLMDRSSRQKVKKQTQTLNGTLDQIVLTDIYKTFHPKAVE